MGPGVDILLRERLTDAQLNAMAEWLVNELGMHVEEYNLPKTERAIDALLANITRKLNVSVADPQRFGLEQVAIGSTNTYTLLVIDKTGLSTEEMNSQFEKCLGYLPAQTLGLSADHQKSVDHVILGYLTLRMAERYGGTIDLNGPLLPPPPRNFYSPANLEAIRSFVRELPGHVCEMMLTAGRREPAIIHLLDVDAFRAWRQQPHFYLVN